MPIVLAAFYRNSGKRLLGLTHLTLGMNALEAGYGSFIDKKGSNYEIQLGAVFRYERCPEQCHPKKAIDLVEGAWLACVPLVDLLRK